jgi:hypothetical protein
MMQTDSDKWGKKQKGRSLVYVVEFKRMSEAGMRYREDIFRSSTNLRILKAGRTSSVVMRTELFMVAPV